MRLLRARRRELNLLEGADITLTITDDAGNEEVDITITAAGSGGSIANCETVTITSESLSQPWNHGLNSSCVVATPLDEPESFRWLEIVDADNVTMHIASVDLVNNHARASLKGQHRWKAVSESWDHISLLSHVV